MPSSSSSNAFARRVSRVSAFPSRTSAIRSARMLGSRKPPRIMPPTRIPCRHNGKPFFAYLRNRGIAARRQPVPELVEVVREISLEVCNRLVVDACRSLIGSYALVRFPHLPFRNVERLCPIHEAPPIAGWSQARAKQRSPFAPVPLRDLHHYYGLLRPCAPHRYSCSHGGLPFERLPWHRGDRFPRSVHEPDPESRRLHAGCRPGSNQAVPRTRPGATTSPRF